MADNINVNPSDEVASVPVATDEIGSIHYPIYKISYGDDGVQTPVSFNKPLPIDTVDTHHVVINELFHRHTGVETTFSAAVTAGDTVINVADGSSINNNDPIELKNGTVEVTFPIVISGGGTNTLQLDRPIDNDFAIGDTVLVVSTDMRVNGSISAPVSFKMQPEVDEIWHIVRFLLAMIHSSEADDSKFGGIAALTNGCILRGYNATADQFRTFTNWKSNFDIKMDMFDLEYTDKAGGTNFGTNGRGAIKDATGAVPQIDGGAGDYLELLIQDDLTGLSKFSLKGQGHIHDPNV